MAETDQTSTDTTATEPTPLAEILDSPADAPAQEADADLGGGIDKQVPLIALRKERERRQKSDRQVEELRSELEKFDNAKYGFDETVSEEQARLDREEQARAEEASQHPAVRNYNQSLATFRSKHGPEGEAKVDAATKRMTRDQQDHVRQLVHTHADPVAAIHAYADQLGLLDFKGTPIEDALASKDKPPEGQLGNQQLAEHIAQLNAYAQQVNATERRTMFAASKTDFVAEHGRDAYNALEQMSTAVAQSGDPVAPHFVEAIKASADPVATAAQLLAQLGLWNASAQHQQAQQPQYQQPARTFPSDLATRRSVGQRHGPAYSGPTPLSSIFRN